MSDNSISECQQSPLQTLDANNAITLPTGWTVQWFDNAGNATTNPTLNATSTINYYAEFTDTNGCKSLTSTEVVLEIKPAPTPPQNEVTTICFADMPTGGIDANDAITLPEPGTITWYTTETGNIIATDPVLDVVDSVTYYAAFTADSTGCTSLDRTEVILTVNPNPEMPEINIDNDQICQDSLDTSTIIYELTTTLEANEQAYWYDESDDLLPIQVGGTTFSSPEQDSGEYRYYVIIDNGLCESQPTYFDYKILESPNFNFNDVGLDQDQPYNIIDLNQFQIDAYGGTGNYEYVVTDITHNEDISVTVEGVFEVEETAMYFLQVFDENGCKVEREVYIEKSELQVPNVFVPNNTNLDLVNVWYPFDILNPQTGVIYTQYENMQVQIFDRYGRLIETLNGEYKREFDEGWDGTYNGKPLPTGDYWYHIKLRDNKNSEFTGHFTLYRRTE